jgi:hypothetical protein
VNDQDPNLARKTESEMSMIPTWDTLRELWFKSKVFSGPSEKFDAEQEWDRFVRGWETDRGDLQTLREAYKNFGARYIKDRGELARAESRERDLRAEVERLREDRRAVLDVVRSDLGVTDSLPGVIRRIVAERDAARTEAATLRTAIDGLLSEDSRKSGREVSCAGYLVTDDGCHVGSLATRLRAVLAAHHAPEAAPPTLTDAQVQAIDDALYNAFSDCDCDHADVREVVVQAIDSVTVVDAEADRD